ncbi:Histidyl-tRNA synthetase [hydrothermal vent metagenome]|uniref:histidine--tRNA ligase n=1 Tax=hydrothermal vent metagenome TaxID=652676 RepID=A0A3B1CRC1_9ZZZZ
MKIQSIRGVKDILPGDIEKWQWVEKIARNVFSRYGFKEIRLPIFENTKLFSKSIGETTDIVEKEMYTFEDRSGEQITLRPEGTASVVRAYIEHKMYNPPSVVKLYYMGPMFRYERPQAGRFRQFYQIGIEAMGTDSPTVDVEVMTLLIEFFRLLGLNNLELQINSLGCADCRPKYRETLKTAIRGHLDELCKNCNHRYERNPLRVLDCKVERDREIAQELPKTKDHLCASCRTNFDQVQTLLDSTQTPYSLNPLLVRGLDYYTRTTFEVVSTGLGAQNAICGGGRYDSLVEEFEGPPTPCFGFALGMERLISVIPFGDKIDLETRPDIFVVGLGDEARSVTFKIIHELRQNGFSVDQDYVGGSMKSQMRKANKSGARFSLIVGENEIKSGKYLLKDMENSSQNEVSAQDLTNALRQQMDNPIPPSPVEN